MKKTYIIGVLSFVVGFLLNPLWAYADVKTYFEVKGSDIVINGTLTSDTVFEFEKLINEHPQVKRIVLGIIEGSIDDVMNLEFGHYIRDLQFATHLRSDSEIYSGGVDIFLAGVERTMERGAMVGVHAWSDDEHEATFYPKDHEYHQGYREYTARMLGKEDFYWYTLKAAPADDMHIMSWTEIGKYRLLTN